MRQQEKKLVSKDAYDLDLFVLIAKEIQKSCFQIGFGNLDE
jgi:hypothetical protein